jgi:nitroreductase
MDGSAKQPQSLRDGLLNRLSVPPRLVDGPAPSQADIDDMLAAAVCAPDHGAIRPWRFHVIQGEALNRLGDLFVEALKKREPDAPRETIEKEQSRPLRAPLIIAACAKIDRSRIEKIPAVEQVVAVASACQNILLAAHDKGYGAMLLTGVNARDSHVKAAFGLDGPDEIVGFIYIGTPSGPVFEKERPDPAEFTTIW